MYLNPARGVRVKRPSKRQVVADGKNAVADGVLGADEVHPARRKNVAR